MESLKLARRNGRQRTVVHVRDVPVGQEFVVIAGPCSVESEEQTLLAAMKVKQTNRASGSNGSSRSPGCALGV